MRYRSSFIALASLVLTLGCSRSDRSYKAVSAPFAAPSQPMIAEMAEPRAMNTENYAHIVDNAFLSPRSAPLSTFSIDVDSASYSNVRRFLNEGRLPPADAVRVEELVNYFTYDYPQPAGKAPFSVTTELSRAPWNEEHQLLLIGLQGRRLEARAMPPRNLVFLVDVSGSMNDQNKLPLLKQSLVALLGTLNERDRVSLVVYAGASGVVLPPTAASDKQTIRSALDQLEAGGSTAGGEGIELAYALAARHFDPKGINRVILATDGDFNVGVSSEGDLVRLIENKRQGGVYLTVLGFGMGNYKDSHLEKLADHGNGNYAYIDSLNEARKVLVEQGGATLVTIAKDVKIQVEFNPERVGAYRLIGYENRVLQARDFNDDRKDAGDIGAGHSVTALYELIGPERAKADAEVDPLKYQKVEASAQAAGAELATIKLRFKHPTSSASELSVHTVGSQTLTIDQASTNLRFAAAVAGFGMQLRKSEYRGNSNYDLLSRLASSAVGADVGGYRAEFLGLLSRARTLDSSAKVQVATP